MSVVSESIGRSIASGSMIRKMFEIGLKLKQQYGEDQVFDFSLGNPDLPPPPVMAEAMHALADKLGQPASLGYMPNAGFPWLLEKLAAWLSAQQEITLSAKDVMLSCGAAGAMNAFFHAVLEPGDEVVGIAPYFVEYGFYVANHGGVFKAVPAMAGSFGPDLAALSAAIGPKTRVILVNSPNNPTGVIYTGQDMKQLAAVVDEASRRYGRPVYLASDEPYRFLAYDGIKVVPMLPLSPNVVILGSFSKNYGMAGERLGYIAISPSLPDKDTLMAGLVLSNRTLGYVNPPVVGQHLLAAALGTSTHGALAIYARRRDKMAAILKNAGYEFVLPQGAFYFFPKAPGGDDQRIVDKLAEHRVLAVPGRGFGYPGHFRLCFAVDESTIDRSADGFKKALQG